MFPGMPGGYDGGGPGGDFGGGGGGGVGGGVGGVVHQPHEHVAHEEGVVGARADDAARDAVLGVPAGVAVGLVAAGRAVLRGVAPARGAARTA